MPRAFDALARYGISRYKLEPANRKGQSLYVLMFEGERTKAISYTTLKSVPISTSANKGNVLAHGGHVVIILYIN